MLPRAGLALSHFILKFNWKLNIFSFTYLKTVWLQGNVFLPITLDANSLTNICILCSLCLLRSLAACINHIVYYYIIQFFSKNSTLSDGCDHNAIWSAYIMTLTVYRCNIEILDASSKIYIEYLLR